MIPSESSAFIPRTRNRPFQLAVALLGTALCGAAFAAPQVQNVSGTLDHRATITITGSGFGSKPTAAPLVFDDASGSNILQLWSGAWPNAVGQYNLAYNAPMRNIDLPHSHVTKYIAGAHATNASAFTGYDVMMFKTVNQAPSYIYASWYQRADNAWHFGGDNNFKTFDYSLGDNPYANNQSWYTAYGPPHPNSNTDSGAQWVIETGTGLTMPDQNGHNAWWGAAVNPMAGKWSKVEVAVKVSSGSDGYLTVWENGKKVVGYSGPTDPWGGSQRTISIGGYARMQGYTTNWRYYDDVYVDTSLARVVLADKAVLSQASIIEVQIPSSWSDSSITATVNLGQFNQGQTAYLFVVDATGTPSAAGVAVTAGGNALAPNPPSGVAVH